MKIRTKCFITVLITYLSMCLASWCACHGLIASGADPWCTILAAGIIAIILTAVGVQLKEQPKCVRLSYVITVTVAWFSALLIFFLLEGVMGSVDGLSTIVYVSAMVLGFPGFAFLMAISEFGTSSAETLSTILYFLCGLIPVIVTFVSVKIKRTFDSE